MNIILNKLIAEYLTFGYSLPKKFPSWIDSCITNDTKGNRYDIDEVNELFDLIFDKLLSKYVSKKHIVPLSGGWDSRVILGALLERVDKKSIETVTYGVPGQLDYEIPKKIAHWADIKHHAIDLNHVPFKWKLMLDEAKNSPWTYMPDCYFNKIARIHLNSDHRAIVWSGFLGDPLFGSHLTIFENKTELALNEYLESQVRVNQFSYWDTFNDETSELFDVQNKSKLNNIDLFDIGIRQHNCIYPIISPSIKWEGWKACIGEEENGNKVIAPFIHPHWAGYWLQCPTRLRLDCSLFRDSMKNKFPELFSLPSKSHLGFRPDEKVKYQARRIEYGIRRRLHKKFPKLEIAPQSNNNYLDYDDAFRYRDDYQETLQIASSYLKKIDAVPWIDLDKLWNEHIKQNENHGEAFQILIGLAANLQVNNHSIQ